MVAEAITEEERLLISEPHREELKRIVLNVGTKQVYNLIHREVLQYSKVRSFIERQSLRLYDNEQAALSLYKIYRRKLTSNETYILNALADTVGTHAYCDQHYIDYIDTLINTDEDRIEAILLEIMQQEELIAKKKEADEKAKETRTSTIWGVIISAVVLGYMVEAILS